MKLGEQRKMFFLVFFIGFILGILYTNLIAIDYLSMTSVFSGYYLNEYLANEWSAVDYLPYVSCVRLIPLAALVFLGYSKFHRVGILIFITWTGFLWGIYMSMGIAYMGLIGIVFCLIGTLPQALLYVPGYLIALIFAYKYPDSKMNGIKIGVISMCMISGIIIECRVNPYIMQWFIEMI